MCSCLSICLTHFSYWRQLLRASIFKLCYCAQERALVNFACTYFRFNVNILLIFLWKQPFHFSNCCYVFKDEQEKVIKCGKYDM